MAYEREHAHLDDQGRDWEGKYIDGTYPEWHPKYQMVDPDTAEAHKPFDSHAYALSAIDKLVAQNKRLMEVIRKYEVMCSESVDKMKRIDEQIERIVK